MVKFSDLFIELLLGFTCIITAAVIAISTNNPFLFFIPFPLYAILHIYLKRKKKIAKYLKDDFNKLGYQILSERPIKISELEGEITFRPAILVNGAPLSRYGYIRKFLRVFTVETQTSERYELDTVITKHWNGKHSIDIKKKTKLKYKHSI